MKTVWVSTLVAALFLTLNIYADRQDPSQPPAFACAYSTQPQTIPSSGDQDANFIPITFEINLISPQGISHDTSGNSAQFTIEQDGSYQINWYLYAQATNVDPTSVQIQLYNVSTDTPIPSSLQEQALTGENRAIIIGSIVVPLQAGTVIELEVAALSTATDVVVTHPLFTISDSAT